MNGARDPFLQELFARVASGEVDAQQAMAEWHQSFLDDELKSTPAVRTDMSRAARHGFPEVIFAEGKTRPDLELAMTQLMTAGGPGLATRVPMEWGPELATQWDEVVWHERARILAWGEPNASLGRLNILAAGTSDLAVAEEAAVTAHMMGADVRRIYDVGVAGLHRLLAVQDDLAAAHVQIVVAGMEGALPSVVGGLVAQPVIAVPTSVGYGASFGGLSALLGMMGSCAPGVVVVNIDNGFGAGFSACRMLRLTCDNKRPQD